MSKRHSFLFRRVTRKEPPVKPISEMTPAEVDREIRLRVSARQQVGLLPTIGTNDQVDPHCEIPALAVPKVTMTSKKKSYITKIPHVSRKQR